jgi:PBS lyase HEAT-like repeat-containing protein
MLACWYFAAASVTPRTPNYVRPPDMSVLLSGVIGMDEVERLIEAFRARATSGATSRLDVLMDLGRLRDPRVVPFLLQVLGDSEEAAEVRIHVIKRLRNGRLALNERRAVALTMIQVLRDGSSSDLRLQSALALAEFTDLEGVVQMLGSIALDVREAIDLRYSAFTSLERAGPTAECVEILRQLSVDETLGRSARSLLSTWQLE